MCGVMNYDFFARLVLIAKIFNLRNFHSYNLVAKAFFEVASIKAFELENSTSNFSTEKYSPKILRVARKTQKSFVSFSLITKTTKHNRKRVEQRERATFLAEAEAVERKKNNNNITRRRVSQHSRSIKELAQSIKKILILIRLLSSFFSRFVFLILFLFLLLLLLPFHNYTHLNTNVRLSWCVESFVIFFFGCDDDEKTQTLALAASEGKTNKH